MAQRAETTVGNGSSIKTEKAKTKTADFWQQAKRVKRSLPTPGLKARTFLLALSSQRRGS